MIQSTAYDADGYVVGGGTYKSLAEALPIMSRVLQDRNNRAEYFHVEGEGSNFILEARESTDALSYAWAWADRVLSDLGLWKVVSKAEEQLAYKILGRGTAR